MKLLSYLKILLIGLLGACSIQAHDHQILLSKIQNCVLAQVQNASDATLKVSSQILTEHFKLPTCEQDLLISLPINQPLIERTNVMLKCPGTQSWAMHLPIKLELMKPVLTLSRTFQPNEKIQAEDLSYQLANILTLNSGYLTLKSQVVGKSTKSITKVGTLLSDKMLISPKVIKRGQHIWILARQPGFQIRTQGKALEDGHMEQRIKIENIKSKRIIEGMVLSQSEVKVEL